MVENKSDKDLGYATDNYKQFRERNTPVSVKTNTDFINAVPEGLGSLNWGEILEESLPLVGETAAIKRASDAFKEGDYLGTGIEAAAGVLGVVPFVGDLAGKALRTSTKKFRNVKPLEIGSSKLYQSGKLLKNYTQLNTKQILQKIDKATAGSKEANKLINAPLTEGTKVGVRLNLNSTIPNMPKGLDKLQTLHKNNYNGKALSYKGFATVENVTFNVSQKGRQGIAANIKKLDVPEAKNKYPAMSVDGNYNSTRNVLEEIDDTIVQIGFNPATGHLFVDMSTGQAVKSADVATVIGDRVFAKGVTYMKKADAPKPLNATDGTILPSEVRYRMNKGGDTMPMEQQMQLFALGGLDDDGMSRDPVSGNTIPAGSMANEVRDDVDAKLSDGEYVVPANVVRFFGVKFFEDLRTQAMQGLGAMEANGRIGGEPMPSAMPMQDQMANSSEELSEQDMAMLQNIMNEGGDVRGYAHGGYHDPVNDPQPIPQSIPSSVYPLTQYASPGASTMNPNLNPYINPLGTGEALETPATVDFRLVTLINPVNGNIQVVQFKGDVPVDPAAYNQLINSGFYVQGSPELAAYKQKIEQDNRDSDKPPERDSAGRLVTRPTPGDATIGELGQLIVESSGNFLTTLAGLTLTGKAAKSMASKTDNIMKVLNERISGTGKYAESTPAQMKAAQVLKDAYTGFKSGKLDKEGLATAISGIYKAPSFQNAIGRKKGKYGSENWFGYISDDEIEKQFGGGVPTSKPVVTTTSRPAVDRGDGNVTPKGGAIIKPSSGPSSTLSSIPTFLQPDNDNDQGGSGGGPSGPTATQGGGMTGSDDRPDDPRGEGQYGGGSNSQPSSSSSTSSNNNTPSSSGPTIGFGGFNMNKGGLLKKPNKKKTKKIKK